MTVRNVLEAIAKDVVIDGKPSFTFTVDGEDFPWLVSERGPKVTRVMDDLYIIDVEILGLSKPPFEILSIGYVNPAAGVPIMPVIDGLEFPWTLTDDDVVLTFGTKRYPTLQLKFYAHSVSGTAEVDDLRMTVAERARWCAGGDLIRDGKDECHECGELMEFSELLTHLEQKHPQDLKAVDSNE